MKRNVLRQVERGIAAMGSCRLVFDQDGCEGLEEQGLVHSFPTECSHFLLLQRAPYTVHWNKRCSLDQVYIHSFLRRTLQLSQPYSHHCAHINLTSRVITLSHSATVVDTVASNFLS